MEEVLSAKREILKAAQKNCLFKGDGNVKPFQDGQERSSAQQKRAMKATGLLYRLDPFLDQDGVPDGGGVGVIFSEGILQMIKSSRHPSEERLRNKP